MVIKKNYAFFWCFILLYFPCSSSQFCEMLSSPSVSSWAGPVIDLLLDYVGNVQLCARLTEHLDSYVDWAIIKEKSSEYL